MSSIEDRNETSDLLDCYVDSLRDAGMYVGRPVVSVARSFFQRVGPAGWSAMSPDEQCELPGKYRRVVGWLMATGRLRATPEYLTRVPAFLGGITSRLYPDTFVAFQGCGSDLGFDQQCIVQQWSAAAKAAALHRRMPDQLSGDLLEQSRQDLRRVARRAARHHVGAQRDVTGLLPGGRPCSTLACSTAFQPDGQAPARAFASCNGHGQLHDYVARCGATSIRCGHRFARRP